MGQTLYLDCFAGISGDMMAGCLIDLGADREKLEKALESLGVEGYQIKISRVKKAGLDVCDFAVVLDEVHENHDHDMEYLHGSDHSHAHGHIHSDEHLHSHEHTHDGEHLHTHMQDMVHSHVHRGLSEINEIICHAAISERAREIALRIFSILAEAEAKAHGVPEQEVHFHEVGAVDSIVDIVAVAVCLDDLDITEVIVPYLCEGKGMVRCQHGMMPIPVPAVANIVSRFQLTIQPTEVEGELVTPTGAAIVAAVRTKDKLPKQYQMLSSGMGAGKRTYSRPGILRGMLLREQDFAGLAHGETIWKLESNIDDCTGEALGYTAELLLENGAADVYYMPIFMKKNRPSYLLAVICKEEKIPLLEKIIFENTTTIGIRKFPVQRSILSRRLEEFDTSYGKVTVKVCTLLDGTKRVYPEYESIRKICKEQNMAYWEVWQGLQQFFAERQQKNRIEEETVQQKITRIGNPGKPQGEEGVQMLHRMNESHYAVTGWALDFLTFQEDNQVLDIGCGGGATLKRMSKYIQTGHLTGVDYSKVSVSLSREYNARDIQGGKMEVLEASVENLPFEDKSFDKIVTVESFYFWPNPMENLKEVFRVLKESGTFLLVAEIYQKEDLKKEAVENVARYHLLNPTPEEFRQMFLQAGFSEVCIHTKEGEDWICVEGIRK